jgi:hypothetical protein
MKLQAPENCGGASVNGEPIELDEDGQVDIENIETIKVLCESHGFTKVVEAIEEKPKLHRKAKDEKKE